MWRARVLFWLMGERSRLALDAAMDVVCGTRKSYDLKEYAPILDLMMHHWLKREDPKG
jgi:hypothetical protein